MNRLGVYRDDRLSLLAGGPRITLWVGKRRAKCDVQKQILMCAAKFDAFDLVFGAVIDSTEKGLEDWQAETADHDRRYAGIEERGSVLAPGEKAKRVAAVHLETYFARDLIDDRIEPGQTAADNSDRFARRCRSNRVHIEHRDNLSSGTLGSATKARAPNRPRSSAVVAMNSRLRGCPP